MILGPNQLRLDEVARRELAGLAAHPSVPVPEWRSIYTDGGGTNRLIAVRLPFSHSSAGRHFDQGALLVKSLEENGIVLIADRDATTPPHSPVALLSGGSICSTWVDVASMMIIKRATASSILPFEDAYGRHLGEFQFLSKACSTTPSLFPDTDHRTTGGGDLEANITFAPGYSLGERVLRSELDGDQLCSLLDLVLDRLASSLWRSLPPGPTQPSYVEVVERRFRQLLHIPVFRRLWDEGAEINGMLVASVRGLLAATRKWGIVSELPAGGAHGDLILEDIVLANLWRGSPEIVLIDPNPTNCSWIVDVAKLFMSTSAYYEVLYAGQFSINVSMNPARCKIEVQLENAAAVATLDTAASHIERRFAALCAEMRSRRLGFDVVEVQTALHLLALPSFHALHHRAHDRAVAFAASGMMRLAAAQRRARIQRAL
jgi:hypothetical protein